MYICSCKYAKCGVKFDTILYGEHLNIVTLMTQETHYTNTHKCIFYWFIVNVDGIFVVV